MKTKKEKSPAVSGKKKEEPFYKTFELPKGCLTDFWKKHPEGIIRILDESILYG
jgi:hypothetical protein